MNQNTGLPQNAPWVSPSDLVTPYQTIVQNFGGFAARRGGRLRNGGRPRVQNLSPLAWGGIGLAAAGLAGGGYYLWNRQQAAALAAATGIEVNEDCTKLKVLDPAVSLPYFNAFIDTTASQMGAAAVNSLIVGAAYLQDVAPGCGVAVTEAGLEGVDTWQKAAMVGGMAILVSGTLHDDGRMSDAQFREQADAIQVFLLEHGVDDLAMVEQVFEMPEGENAQGTGGGLGGGGTIAGRQSNIGVMGVLGLGVLGMGAAAAGAGAWLWNRNKKLTQACLGETKWLEADGSLSEGAEAQLHTAILEVVADGARNAMEAGDAAIIKVSENPGCRLPVLIWGDLLRVRALAAAMAVHIGAFEDLEPPTQEGPGRGVTGLEADASCTSIVMHDQPLSEAYFGEFLSEFPELQPGIDWVPNTIHLGAQFLQRIAPHCGVRYTDQPIPTGSDITGVDTWQKAAMVGAFAIVATAMLKDRGVISDADAGQQMENIGAWLRAHGVDDLSMLEDVFKTAGTPGLVQRPTGTTDEWGQPTSDEVVDNGSVGGEGGGLWRVYKDNVGEYDGKFYFVIWRAGEYTEQGPFATAAVAAEGALDLLTGQQPGIAPKGNPSRKPKTRIPDFLQLLGGWGKKRRRRLRNPPVGRPSKGCKLTSGYRCCPSGIGDDWNCDLVAPPQPPGSGALRPAPIIPFGDWCHGPAFLMDGMICCGKKGDKAMYCVNLIAPKIPGLPGGGRPRPRPSILGRLTKRRSALGRRMRARRAR